MTTASEQTDQRIRDLDERRAMTSAKVRRETSLPSRTSSAQPLR